MGVPEDPLTAPLTMDWVVIAGDVICGIEINLVVF